MHQLGEATCEAYQHEARILVDMLVGDLPVPDVTLVLRCSRIEGHHDAPAGTARVANVVLVGAVPPVMISTDEWPGGDQIVPIGHAGELAARIVAHAQILVYEGAPHGLATTHQDKLNADLLAFARS